MLDPEFHLPADSCKVDKNNCLLDMKKDVIDYVQAKCIAVELISMLYPRICIIFLSHLLVDSYFGIFGTKLIHNPMLLCQTL